MGGTVAVCFHNASAVIFPSSIQGVHIMGQVYRGERNNVPYTKLIELKFILSRQQGANGGMDQIVVFFSREPEDF